MNHTKNFLTREISVSDLKDKLKTKAMQKPHFTLYLIICIGIFLRLFGTIYTKSVDYPIYLEPWVHAYAKLPLKQALSASITNYYVPYNIVLILLSRLSLPPYIGISFTSCLAEGMTIYFIYKLLELKENYPLKNMLISASLLLLPCTFIDSAFWKQCDAIYAMFAVISLYFYFAENYTKAFLFYALGFCCKLQIIFLLPFYLFLWFYKRKHSIFQFLCIPVMYLLTGLPSILAGADFTTIYRIYFSQTKQYPETSISYPNIYGLLPSLTGNLVIHLTEIITILLLCALFLLIIYKKVPLTLDNNLWLAGTTIWTCTMFLPCMHERYDYLALILLWVYCLASHSSLRRIYFSMQIIMTCTYFNWCFIYTFPLPLLSAFYLYIYLRQIYKTLFSAAI